MRNEEEVRNLFEKFQKLLETIEQKNQIDQYKDDECFGMICDASDTLAWVLGSISTENFLSKAYTGFEDLREKVSKISQGETGEAERVRNFLIGIIEDEKLSLLVPEPMETVKSSLKISHYKTNYSKLKNIFEEVLEKTGDSELAELVDFMEGNEGEIRRYLEEKRKMANDRERKKELINETRAEISEADLTTNEELEDKEIKVLSFDFTHKDLVLVEAGGERWTVKPNWQQKQQVRSWSFKGKSWPLETQILKKGNVYVFKRTW